MKIVDINTNIKIPPEIAICPICGAEVVVIIEEYEKNDDGTWQASENGIRCNCITDPDIESDEWEDWFNSHWSTPYLDWFPVTKKVYKWLTDNYRFILEEPQ